MGELWGNFASYLPYTPLERQASYLTTARIVSVICSPVNGAVT
jgi:hypothetical protein